MPYNTRRKSLSLPSLGIQLPNTSRAHRPSAIKASPTETSPPQHQQQQSPPTKKIKRSHTSTSPVPATPSRQRSSTASSHAKVVSFADRPKSSGRAAYEHTPPPSPGAASDSKVDTNGIHDDIVVGVIEQLEITGNRPHLIKELAAVLSNISDAVSRYVMREPQRFDPFTETSQFRKSRGFIIFTSLIISEATMDLYQPLSTGQGVDHSSPPQGLLLSHDSPATGNPYHLFRHLRCSSQWRKRRQTRDLPELEQREH